MGDVIEPQGVLPDYLADVRASRGDAVAFQEVHPDPSVLPPGKGTDELTFDELDAAANRVADSLRSLGVGRGDVVSYQLPNWVEFPVLHLAVAKAGGVSQPILPEHRANEVGFMVDLCGSDVLVVPAEFRGFDHLGMVRDLLAEGTIDPSTVVVVGDYDRDAVVDAPAEFRPWSWLLDGDPAPVESPLELDDLEQVMFTSGTTGEPKGVRQTARVGLHQILTPNADVLGIDASDVLFAPSPLAHNTGYHFLMRMGMLTGARVVFFDKWLPERALETLAAESCTFCFGATTFLKDLLDHPAVGDYPLPDLRLFTLGGSDIPRPVVEDAYDRFANVTLVRVWGQTENGLVTATRPDDPFETIATRDGRPVSHCEVTVRDTYDGDEVRNERGKLLMRGDPLTDGYYDRPELTRQAFTDDGWFITGDLAVLHDDGYISIEGREKDIIIRGGENISAAEVEEHVLTHPTVREVAVVAMPDDRLQERPCAYVTLAPGYDADDLTVESLSAFLADRGLQVHKHPERVELLDAFPRTSTGKIQKFELRDRIAETVESERN